MSDSAKKSNQQIMEELYAQIVASQNDEHPVLVGFLEYEEMQKLILGFLEGSNGATSDEVFTFLKYAEQIRVENTLLDLVVAGAMKVGFPEDAIEPAYSIGNMEVATQIMMSDDGDVENNPIFKLLH